MKKLLKFLFRSKQDNVESLMNAIKKDALYVGPASGFKIIDNTIYKIASDEEMNKIEYNK